MVDRSPKFILFGGVLHHHTDAHVEKLIKKQDHAQHGTALLKYSLIPLLKIPETELDTDLPLQ
jgi:hypothetical protein